MNNISIYFFGFLFFFGAHTSAQTTEKNPPMIPEYNLIQTGETINYKSSQRSYNADDIELRRVNDTLGIYLEGQKKLSIIALNIVELENFAGFEKDIDSFFELIDQLGLDTDTKPYEIRYSPRSNEVRVKDREEIRFKRFEGGLLPVFRHEIIFTYQKEMLEVNLYLGEIDELLVLKDAGFSEIIKKEALENDWFKKYEKRTFNKDITIDESGDIGIVTYGNFEANGATIGFDISMGASLLGNEFPFREEVSLVFKTNKFNKWTQVGHGVFIGAEFYQFFSRNQENKVQLDNSSFINVGWLFGVKDTPVSIFYGRFVGDDTGSFFEFNKNKFGLDVLVKSSFRIKYEVFVGSNDSDWINSIGISFPLIPGR
ncbi:hypothetical protein [Algoriphagus marincola]|jgi:hypothetical protein|uniref:hypothetical protein n=1 Tax=Algoriphagus marincola TaxID=264027 RepID=UPI00047899E1|nr:hypothetical protein [Algoriphagus marincola]